VYDVAEGGVARASSSSSVKVSRPPCSEFALARADMPSSPGRTSALARSNIHITCQCTDQVALTRRVCAEGGGVLGRRTRQRCPAPCPKRRGDVDIEVQHARRSEYIDKKSIPAASG